MKPFSINVQTASPIQPVCLRRLTAFSSRRGFCVTNESWNRFAPRFKEEKDKASISPGMKKRENQSTFDPAADSDLDRAACLGELVLCRAENGRKSRQLA